MLENLIQAYRKEFYDWSLREWCDLLKKNKKLSKALMFLLVFASVVVIGVYWLKWLVCMGGIGIIVVCVYIDRIIVGESRQYIANKQEHLEEVKLFLESAIRGQSLFSERSIQILIERLSNKVESQNPFYNIWGKVLVFVKTCIVPIVTFVAGIYSQRLSEMDVMTLLGGLVSLLIICGIFGLLWIVIAAFVRNILFRDIDAAIFLREELLDLKMIYFNDDSPKY